MSGSRVMMMLVLAGGAQGADLAEEIAAWGPVSTGSADIHDGQWFAQGIVVASAAAPINGLFVVNRDLPTDVQVACGTTYDRSGSKSFGYGFDQWYDWGRMYVRGGTDPLADESGQGIGVLGVSICAPILLSLHGEIGYSAERKKVANGEISFFVVRVRGEVDDHARTVRIGTGPRILGTAGPWAWGAMLDWATSHWTDDALRLTSDGGIVTGYVVWRPLNHLLLAAEAQVADHTIDLSDPTAPKRAVAQFSLALGVTF